MELVCRVELSLLIRVSPPLLTNQRVSFYKERYFNGLYISNKFL